MPAMPAPVTDERSGLLAFLEFQRQLLRTAAFGLTDEQARSTPSVSSLSVGGLIKHLAHTERTWVDTVLQRRPDGTNAETYLAAFSMGPDETLAELFDDYAAAAAETRAATDGLDLDHPVPVPDLPWFPDDADDWSIRWVLLHLIEETARHVGHADVIRESIDGATWYPLMAARDGLPATPWLQPWTPETAAGN